jgi:hypothetical protein
MYDGVRSHASKATLAHRSQPVAGSASRGELGMMPD